MKYCWIYILLLSSLQTEAQPLRLKLLNSVNGRALQLDTAQYRNAFNEAFTVTKFRYYISNIKLVNSKGKKFSVKDTWLIDAAKPSSQFIQLNKVPAGIYDAIEFIIGVDSIHNCSGAQTGALDPLNGMFWTWNSGYIFCKLEGRSTASALPAGLIEYHIGGYRTPNNCIRAIRLSLKQEKTRTIEIAADIDQLLGAAHPVNFAALPSVTGLEHATEIADNYAAMFRVIDQQ